MTLTELEEWERRDVPCYMGMKVWVIDLDLS